MKNSGIVFTTDKGEYAIAYHKEQTKEFQEVGKILVHLFKDEKFTPQLDDKGQPKKVLKSITLLKHVGYCD